MKNSMIEVRLLDATSGGRGGRGVRAKEQTEMMTRATFAALPGERQVDACITFDHGPDRAAIHHDIKDASVRYILSLYPAFDSIRITRLIAPQLSAYAVECADGTATRAIRRTERGGVHWRWLDTPGRN